MTDSAVFKLVLVGERNVGKTALFNKYLYGEEMVPESMMGAYYSQKKFHVDDKEYEVKIWDTAGEGKFASLTKLYTRGAHAAIIIYDITDRDTWKAVERWCNELKDEDCATLIAGNNLDLVTNNQKERQVSWEDVQKFAHSIDAFAIEGSSTTGQNVNKMFQKVMEESVRRKLEHLRDTHTDKWIDFPKPTKSKKNSSCNVKVQFVKVGNFVSSLFAFSRK